MMLPQGRYVLYEIFVIVRRFSQKLQSRKLNMIKREMLARHPRTIWRISACDVTPTSRNAPAPLAVSDQVEDDTEILIRHNVWGCGPKFWTATQIWAAYGDCRQRATSDSRIFIGLSGSCDWSHGESHGQSDTTI